MPLADRVFTSFKRSRLRHSNEKSMFYDMIMDHKLYRVDDRVNRLSVLSMVAFDEGRRRRGAEEVRSNGGFA